MKINKDGISEKDHEFALRILQQLRQGKRCIGNPAEGLKKTLLQLEKSGNVERGETEFVLNDAELKANIAKTKAGITGEETLAEYMQRLSKLNPRINDVVLFASLSYEQDNNEKDYIPDTDFIAVYGTNLMIIDAKNITTSPNVPIYLEDNVIKTPTKDLIEVRPSVHIWKKVFDENNVEYSSIDGTICVVNKSGATVYKNKEWYAGHTKLIHISELEKYLMDWIERCDEKETNVVSLKLLTEISKTQIREETSGLDLSKIKLKFGV